MTVEKTDSHTHTFYSGHGQGSVDEVVESALTQGMTMVALTEHLPLPLAVDPDATFGMTVETVDSYLADVYAAREKFPAIEVICGFECDWRYGAKQYLLELLQRYPHELALGSVHMLSYPDGSFWEFDYPPTADGWESRGEELVWNEYFNLWMQAVASKVPFNIMTHPDLPKKLGHKPKFDTREYYAAMAEAAAKAEVMIELNTSGLHYAVAELYPAPLLLHAFHEAGVPCTISSDAHAPENVGRSFDAGYAALRAAGYSYITVPTHTGDRRQIPLL